MFDVDTSYYGTDLLQKLVPGIPPRFEIGFDYPGDIDDFDELVAAWADGHPKEETGDGMQFEDWMPKAEGYWNTGFDVCVAISSVPESASDLFGYEYSIGRTPNEGEYSRSQWIRDVIDAFVTEDISQWEWDGELLQGYYCDCTAFSCPTELLIYKEHFLNWYEDWVKQGRPVRALSFKGDIYTPVFGELEYEER